MDHSLRKTVILLGLCFFLMYSITRLYQPSIPPKIKELEEGFIPIKVNKELAHMFAFGQQRLIASFIWIESMLNADHHHHKNPDDQSGLYYKYKTIVDLDPFFYEAYYNGGVYLSIIKDDDIGAKLIYDRGLKVYPDDYHVLLNSAFHYYFELHDHETAIKLLKRLIDKHREKVPKNITILYARLNTLNDGGLKNAKTLIHEAWKNAPANSPQQKHLYDRLYAINAELDLNCLNSFDITKFCNNKDLDGYPYILKNRKYFARKKWKQFTMRKNRKDKKQNQKNYLNEN